MKLQRTLYDVLEVSQLASPVVLRAAYRSLVQSLHPDKNPGSLVAGERLAEINNAYAVVSDPAKRLKYDRTLGLNTACTERRGIAPADQHFVSISMQEAPFRDPLLFGRSTDRNG